MTKKSRALLVVASLFLAFCATTARAGQKNLLHSEEGFVAQMSGRAVFVAPGVYEVKLASGERIRVGFGEDGRRYDQARLRQELREAMAASDAAAQSRKIQVLTHALRGLADAASVDQKAAVTGWTCKYEFTLDGGFYLAMIGGQSWGNASIGLDLDFGPPAPPSYFPKRTAYTYVSATGDNPFYAEDYDEVLSGLGTASTSAVVDCGMVFDFSSWESFSYVREYNCTGGYRSIQRLG